MRAVIVSHLVSPKIKFLEKAFKEKTFLNKNFSHNIVIDTLHCSSKPLFLKKCLYKIELESAYKQALSDLVLKKYSGGGLSMGSTVVSHSNQASSFAILKSQGPPQKGIKSVC